MFINRENVFIDLIGENKYDIIKEIINKSTIEDSIKEYVYEKVKEREEMQSTAVGNGVGVAHARLNGIQNVEVLVGFVKGGVDYDAYDDNPVNVVFVVLTPVDKSREYLNVLARISKMCRGENNLKELFKKKENNKIFEIFDNFNRM